MSQPTLVYVYAIVPVTSKLDTALTRNPVLGLGGQPVRALAAGDLAAIVGDVPANEFDEAPLNEHLRDLDWLAPRAAAHQAVNAALFERTPAILPLSFGAIFRRPEPVVKLLEERGSELRQRLDRVRGRGEWVVSVLRDATRVMAAVQRDNPALLALRADLARSGPGRRYLLTRRMQDARRQAVLAADLAAIAAAKEALTAAEALVDEPLAVPGQSEAPSAQDVQTIARLSALVPRTAEASLATAVAALKDALRPRGYDVALSGPWPPYRFSGTGTEVAAAATRAANSDAEALYGGH